MVENSEAVVHSEKKINGQVVLETQNNIYFGIYERDEYQSTSLWYLFEISTNFRENSLIDPNIKPVSKTPDVHKSVNVARSLNPA